MIGALRPRTVHPVRTMRRARALVGSAAHGTRVAVRSVCAGAAGTAALTLAYAAERRLRPAHEGQLDYDDSLVPGQIVASVMHLPHVTAREDRDLGLALRWGYGSAFGSAARHSASPRAGSRGRARCSAGRS